MAAPKKKPTLTPPKQPTVPYHPAQAMMAPGLSPWETLKYLSAVKAAHLGKTGGSYDASFSDANEENMLRRRENRRYGSNLEVPDMPGGGTLAPDSAVEVSPMQRPQQAALPSRRPHIPAPNPLEYIRYGWPASQAGLQADSGPAQQPQRPVAARSDGVPPAVSVPAAMSSRMSASIDAMRAARAADEQQIHARQWAGFDARRAAVEVKRTAPRSPAGPAVPLGTTTDRNENLRMAAAAESKARGVRDAGFLKWKAETTAKAKAYDAGETVRLGVNGQIVAKKTSAIDAQRIAQNQANALRRRAEMEQFYAKRGQRLVYGPAGSMAIAANAPAPAGFDGQPGMPQPIMAARPAGPGAPTMIAQDSDFAVPGAPGPMPSRGPVAPQAGAPVTQGLGGVPGAAMGQAGFKQLIARAAQALGRMPKSVKEIMAALGARPELGGQPYDPGYVPIIGRVPLRRGQAQPPTGSEFYSGSM
jgi:hypothetical protein